MQTLYEESIAEFEAAQCKEWVLFLTMICACPLGKVPVASAFMGS